MDETWDFVWGFDDYLVSNMGSVYNRKTEKEVRQSHTMQGALKVNLRQGEVRVTKSVRTMVAEQFVEKPNRFSNTVVILNGDQEDLRAENLVWRPRWFAWNYTAQLKTEQPPHYYDLAMQDLETGYCFENVVSAGMNEGLLFDDVWRSYQDVTKIFPLNGPFVRCSL